MLKRNGEYSDRNFSNLSCWAESKHNSMRFHPSTSLRVTYLISIEFEYGILQHTPALKCHPSQEGNYSIPVSQTLIREKISKLNAPLSSQERGRGWGDNQKILGHDIRSTRGLTSNAPLSSLERGRGWGDNQKILGPRRSSFVLIREIRG